MTILILNCGSSSVKYQVYDWNKKEVLATGVVERVGTDEAYIDHTGRGEKEIKQACPTHTEAIDLIFSCLLDKEVGCINSLEEISVVGNRIVHGGEKFSQSVLLTPEVIKELETISNLAPLHNPANIMGIRAVEKSLPNVPQIAIFDTSWHQTMKDEQFLYALPREWYTQSSIRRYGFHGTSFLYTSRRASVILGKEPKNTNVIIAHIGNGASMNAVKEGKSFDTSMGFTPLEGLVMGTRSGDIDPAIATYMMQKLNIDAKEMDATLNKKSGILGITTQYIDRRDVEINAQKGDELCHLAIEMESYRIKKYIGSYLASLNGEVDAIIFTAGVGEMGPLIREKALAGLDKLGIELDKEKNNIAKVRNAEVCISKPSSRIKIFVIPTDEELVMVEDCVAILNKTYKKPEEFKYSFESPSYINQARAKKWQAQIAKKPELASLEVKAGK